MAKCFKLRGMNSRRYSLLNKSKISLHQAGILIEEALPILDTKDWENAEEFLEPRGQLRCTIVHLASYSGRLEVLQQANALQVDLYVTDALQRSPLHYAADQGQVDVVRWLVERSISSNQLQLEDSFGRTALHLAVKFKHVDVVKLLVDEGVDVNIPDKDKMSPLHLAWLNVDWKNPEQMSSYENIVNIILGSVVYRKFVDMPLGVSRTMVLSSAVRLNSIEATRQLLERGLIALKSPYSINQITTPLHIAANHGFHQTLCTLLQYLPLTSWMINMRDELSRTPLQIAVSQGQLECAHTLVMNKASLVSSGKNWPTVIDALFRYNDQPMAFLESIFDTAICTAKIDANTAILNFEILAPKGKRQMAVISDLISTVSNEKELDILQHPVVTAFLGLKWKRFKYFHLVIIFFRTLFAICLYAYSLELVIGNAGYATSRRVLLVFSSILLCHTTLKLTMIPKYYIKQFETWLSIISTTMCIVVTVDEEFRMDSISVTDSSEQQRTWAVQSVSIATLSTYLQLMLLFGRFSVVGHYALMFTTVLTNVLQVFLMVVWIVIGFALSFSVLFYGKGNFDHPLEAITKTVVMMMGEYEYSNLFLPATANDSLIESNPHNIRIIDLPIINRIFFLAFILLASIVLMNLMIGLAVTDIQGLVKKGQTLRLLKQIETMDHLERVTSHRIFRSRMVPRCLKAMLKTLNTIPTQIELRSSTKYGERPRCFTERQVKKLIQLAGKNRNLSKKKFQRSYSCHEHEDGLTETILQLQEAVNRLQQEMMRIHGKSL